MADTFTGHLNLVLPEVGASRNAWGSKLNADLQALDSYTYARMPPGAMVDFCGTVVPDGWFPCDGRALDRVTYAGLFAAIGTIWGAGDGSATFNIPDMRGRLAIGAGNAPDSGGLVRGLALAESFGYWLAALYQSNLPNVDVVATGDHGHVGSADLQGAHAHAGSTEEQGAHNHNFYSTSVNTGGISIAGSPASTLKNISDITGVAGAHSHNISTDTRGEHSHNIYVAPAGGHTHSLGGGGLAHENMQPSVGVTKIIFTGKVAIGSTRTTSDPSLPVPAEALGHPA